VTSLVEYLTNEREQFIADLGTLVNRDCGTYNKQAVDAVGQWISERCRAWGWEVERYPLPEVGDCWLARLRGKGQARLFLSGHLDTVYPDGTAAARPMTFLGSKILGPGACDMKAGVLAGMYAMRALQVMGEGNFAEIAFFFNSDEEVGSLASRPLYTPVVREMDAAFVLESGRANGDIVSARKGAGLFTIAVTGRAAHAGVEPEKGANAIFELAHQIIAAQRLNGIVPGVTVSLGLVGGGTRTNVVPDEAWARVDVRAMDPIGAETVTNALMELPEHITVERTQVTVTGSFGCPPMPKTEATRLLVEWTQQCAHELGFRVNDAATGGVSDANVIAGAGVPVVDGLGPVGGLDHGPDEYIDAESIVPRTAMLAGLLRRAMNERSRLLAMRSVTA
jgi:glutamate carboxypeptidase